VHERRLGPGHPIQGFRASFGGKSIDAAKKQELSHIQPIGRRDRPLHAQLRVIVAAAAQKRRRDDLNAEAAKTAGTRYLPLRAPRALRSICLCGLGCCKKFRLRVAVRLG
jgi:hypothetical protein